MFQSSRLLITKLCHIRGGLWSWSSRYRNTYMTCHRVPDHKQLLYCAGLWFLAGNISTIIIIMMMYGNVTAVSSCKHWICSLESECLLSVSEWIVLSLMGNGGWIRRAGLMRRLQRCRGVAGRWRCCRSNRSHSVPFRLYSIGGLVMINVRYDREMSVPPRELGVWTHKWHPAHSPVLHVSLTHLLVFQ